MNILRVSLFLISLFCIFSSSSAHSQGSTIPRHYICYKTAQPVKIDGKAEELCWQKVSWTDDFVDILGAQGATPRFRTRAKMVWDRDYFYVFAEIYEPHIWANLSQRDATIYNDNDFEVFLDPDGDTHHYYEYEMNALNTQWDLLLTKPYRDGGIPITAWNFDGMKSAVNVQGSLNNPADIDRKWSVEIAFPMKSMVDSMGTIPVKSGDQWRVNFSRVEWQTLIENGRYIKVKNPQTGKPLPEDNWVWSPQGVINMHCPDKWGFVQFSDLTAGSGAAIFRIDPKDAVKDELRILYYAQKQFFAGHQKYAGSLADLSSIAPDLSNLKIKPVFKLTANGYEIIAPQPESVNLWHIDQAGRVWPDR